MSNWRPRGDGPKPVPVSESEVDLAHATRAKESIPVTVMLPYDDGGLREVKGFAKGWTKEHVYVQVPWPEAYYQGTREVWVHASQVQRRQLQEPPRRWPQ